MLKPMFGLSGQEKYAKDIRAGEYVLLGGTKLLHVDEIRETEGVLHLITEAGKLLFASNDILRVI